MIVWLDLETTGLDAEKDLILEVACVVTTDQLAELGRFHAVTDYAKRVPLCSLPVRVQEMHLENGLWLDSLRNGQSADSVASAFHNFLVGEMKIPKDPKPLLAGNTISFDRRFLQEKWPLTASLFHYRDYNVTTLHEFFKGAAPDVYTAAPGRCPGHRAMPDILSSLENTRYYAQKVKSL